DSIIDIVGSAILLDLLITQNSIEKIYSSPVSDGYGFTYCQHGKIPVPVPATAEIFSDAKVKTRQLDIPKEMVTPTGAAIIAEISGNFGLMPEMTSLKTGYGAGTRDLDIPNVVRVILGKTQNPEIFNISDNSYITVIETNIDDCSPEIIAYTLEKLLKSGANDVFFTPVYMKKNRPGVKLTVLCKSAPEIINKLTKIIFDETTTIGLRIREEKRICLKRESKIIDTKYGGLKIKEIEFNGEKKYFPEYESAKELAEKSDAPLYKIYESVKQKQIF
ncbi:MAG: LarC family nickel insertion protein, partial [Oscillospiraceae bacterium]|nr:LarC family nickel insertion protein [Oscillospiraceae bacterium]